VKQQQCCAGRKAAWVTNSEVYADGLSALSSLDAKRGVDHNVATELEGELHKRHGRVPLLLLTHDSRVRNDFLWRIGIVGLVMAGARIEQWLAMGVRR